MTLSLGNEVLVGHCCRDSHLHLITIWRLACRTKGLEGSTIRTDPAEGYQTLSFEKKDLETGTDVTSLLAYVDRRIYKEGFHLDTLRDLSAVIILRDVVQGRLNHVKMRVKVQPIACQRQARLLRFIDA